MSGLGNVDECWQERKEVRIWLEVRRNELHFRLRCKDLSSLFLSLIARVGGGGSGIPITMTYKQLKMGLEQSDKVKWSKCGICTQWNSIQP